MFPGNKMKALTFTYDDGIVQDIRFVDMLNRYGLKGTFNLNSGLIDRPGYWNRPNVRIRYLTTQEMTGLYQGHEIASHSLTHPHLEKLALEEAKNELEQDISNLRRWFDTEIDGFAFPYGTYNDQILRMLPGLGIRYARTGESSYQFGLPNDLLQIRATCRHSDLRCMELAREFVALQPKEPVLFMICGHSYEFDIDNNWDEMEDFCSYISNRDDIFYGTNRQVLLL